MATDVCAGVSWKCVNNHVHKLKMLPHKYNNNNGDTNIIDGQVVKFYNIS